MNPPDDRRPDAHDERDAPMTDERCLAVLSLLFDDRPVNPELAAAARAHAARDARLAAVERDWRELRRALADEAPRRAGPGFTERVLLRLPARDGSRPLAERPLLRRLAMAAALVVAALLALDIARPPALHADSARQLRRHAVDGFRATPWQADDILGGLRARLADPDFRPGLVGSPFELLPAPAAASGSESPR